MFEPSPSPLRQTIGEGRRRPICRPTSVQRAPGPGTQLVGLLAAIRWEAQFKLAKCCMRASKSISDLGVFLAEPVLERSKALNDAGHGCGRMRPADPSRCLPSFCPILFRLALHRRRLRIFLTSASPASGQTDNASRGASTQSPRHPACRRHETRRRRWDALCARSDAPQACHCVGGWRELPCGSSIGSRLISRPSSSSRSKANRKARASLRRRRSVEKIARPLSSQHTTSPSIRPERTLRWLHRLHHETNPDEHRTFGYACVENATLSINPRTAAFR